jgi:hypothetical protein
MCHGRRLLDLIADRLCAALLAEKGGCRHRKRRRPQGRRRRQNSSRGGWGRRRAAIDDPAQRHFDAIIHYEDVLIAALHGHRPAV